MKYYLICGITDSGSSTYIGAAKNKYEALKQARNACPHERYLPVRVKRLSKKYFSFIKSLARKEKESEAQE